MILPFSVHCLWLISSCLQFGVMLFLKTLVHRIFALGVEFKLWPLKCCWGLCALHYLCNIKNFCVLRLSNCRQRELLASIILIQLNLKAFTAKGVKFNNLWESIQYCHIVFIKNYRFLGFLGSGRDLWLLGNFEKSRFESLNKIWLLWSFNWLLLCSFNLYYFSLFCFSEDSLIFCL